MRGKITKLLILPLIAIMFASMTFVQVPRAQAQGPATLTVDHVTDTTLTPGSTFTVSVNVADVIDLYGIEFKIAYDTNMVTALGVSAGSFWVGGVTEWINDISTPGVIWYSVTRPFGTPGGLSGAGTIATIDFSVVGTGVTPLHLFDVLAGNRFAVPIELVLSDGSFANALNILVALRTAHVGTRHLIPPAAETIDATFKNLGTGMTSTYAQFAIFDELGNLATVLTSSTVSLAPNANGDASVSWSGYTVLTKYTVEVSVFYLDPYGVWTIAPKGDVTSSRTTMVVSFVVEA